MSVLTSEPVEFRLVIRANPPTCPAIAGRDVTEGEPAHGVYGHSSRMRDATQRRARARGSTNMKSRTSRGKCFKSSPNERDPPPTINTPRRIANKLKTVDSAENVVDA